MRPIPQPWAGFEPGPNEIGLSDGCIFGGDWRLRFDQDLPVSADLVFFSFDPYIISSAPARCPEPANNVPKRPRFARSGRCSVTVVVTPAGSVVANVSCPVAAALSSDKLSLNLTATCSNLPVDAYTVTWVVTSIWYEGGITSALGVYDPSRSAFVAASGTVQNNGVPADFALAGNPGSPSGGLVYVEHRASGDFIVVTTGAVMVNPTGSWRMLMSLNAKVNGTAGNMILTTFLDGGTSASSDRFGFAIVGPAATFSYSPLPLSAGNPGLIPGGSRKRN